jgi:hypothetical protein
MSLRICAVFLINSATPKMIGVSGCCKVKNDVFTIMVSSFYLRLPQKQLISRKPKVCALRAGRKDFSTLWRPIMAGCEIPYKWACKWITLEL